MREETDLLPATPIGSGGKEHSKLVGESNPGR